MSENCYECGHSVEWGSGRYVNRVPADCPDGMEEYVKDPTGEWICAECLCEGEESEVVFHGDVALTDYDMLMKRLAGDNKEKLQATVPVTGEVPADGRVRLSLDFPNPQSMIEWFAISRGHLLPEDVVIYTLDALDGQYPVENSFIVKRDGDRPEDFKLQFNIEEA